MTSSNTNKLKVGVLGMPDNQATKRLLDYFDTCEDVSIDFVVYWKPNLKEQLRRTARKLRAAGLLPTFQRVWYALFRSNKHQEDPVSTYRKYFVPGHNSVECCEILIAEQVDILLLATDAIITKRIFEIPRMATLNGHPGWAPQFRGLGSLYFQLEAGYYPGITVHQVDAGIDTGPILLREYFKVDPEKGLEEIESQVNELRSHLLAEGVRLLQKGSPEYLDTFHEPSNMTRGMSLKRKKRLAKALLSNDLSLEPPRHYEKVVQSELQTHEEPKPPPLRIWTIQQAEPIPSDLGFHPMRTGSLSKALADAGCEVHWFTSSFDHGKKRFRTEGSVTQEWGENIKVHLLRGPGYKKNSSLARVLHSHRTAGEFLNLANTMERPDLILASYPSPELCAAASEYADKHGIPFHLDVRDLWPDSIVAEQSLVKKLMLLPLVFHYQRKLRRSLAVASGVISMSNSVLSWALQKANRVKGEKDRVFFLGYDGGDIHRNEKLIPDRFTEEEPMQVVFYGMFGKAHNGEMVIDTARLMEAKGERRIVFVMAGNGELRAEWEKRAEGLPNIRFTGWLGKNEAQELLFESHLGVVGTRGGVKKYWFGNKFFEYLAHGVVVINDAMGELSEFISDTKVGKNMSSSEPEVLASALNFFLEDTAALKEYSKNCREIFSNQMNSKDIYSEYAAFLVECAENSLAKDEGGEFLKTRSLEVA